MYFVYSVDIFPENRRFVHKVHGVHGFLRCQKACIRKEHFMDKAEWVLLDKLLCASYDGKPVTIRKSDNGKIVAVDVHDDEECGSDGG